ncbi:MAG: hypothetical protein ACLUFV_09690 [Acutalibacteraceae bacterium]
MNKHEKRLNILTAAVFLVLLYTLAVIFLLKPAQSTEEENRNLQGIPRMERRGILQRHLFDQNQRVLRRPVPLPQRLRRRQVAAGNRAAQAGEQQRPPRQQRAVSRARQHADLFRRGRR